MNSSSPGPLPFSAQSEDHVQDEHPRGWQAARAHAGWSSRRSWRRSEGFLPSGRGGTGSCRKNLERQQASAENNWSFVACRSAGFLELPGARYRRATSMPPLAAIETGQSATPREQEAASKSSVDGPKGDAEEAQDFGSHRGGLLHSRRTGVVLAPPARSPDTRMNRLPAREHAEEDRWRPPFDTTTGGGTVVKSTPSALSGSQEGRAHHFILKSSAMNVAQWCWRSLCYRPSEGGAVPVHIVAYRRWSVISNC